MAEWTFPFMDRSEAIGTFGVVAANHRLAAQTAMGVLERGGNAFDAVAAAGFVFHVVEPHMDGLGGELVALLCPAEDETPVVLCGQGVAPAATAISKFHALGRKLIPSSGLLPAVVPGAFGAWMTLLRDYGTMGLREILAPAIHYAETGYPLSAEVSREIDKSADVFRTRWPTSAACFLRDGAVPAPGSLFCRPDLAQTYKRIVRHAQNASADRDRQFDAAYRYFYRGPIAEAVERFLASRSVFDETGAPEESFLTAQDMAEWQPTYEKPVWIDWHGYRFFKAGFWSQGPVFLQFLQLLEHDDIEALDTAGEELSHLAIEAAKLAFADREAWYGDGGRPASELGALLTPDYARRRRKLIGSDASDLFRPGSISSDTAPNEQGASRDRPFEMADTAQVRRYGPSDGDTSHIDIIDRWGNLVSAIPSGGWLQGSPIIPGLGLSLSTRGQMFWLDENSPSRLQPRTRPRTTLSPTIAIAHRDGVRLGFGSKGADFADQWAAQFAIRHFSHKLPLQAAMDAPMFGCEHWPNSVYPREPKPRRVQVDPRFPEAARRALEARGHVVKLAPVNRQGRNCAVWTDGHLKKAAASLRMVNAAAVGR